MASASAPSEDQLFACLFPGQRYSADKANLLVDRLREVADCLEQQQQQREREKEEARAADPQRLTKRQRKELTGRGRDIDFGTYQQRYVALELLYLGHDYGGFARQATTPETIEGHLFDALKRVRLIPPDETWQNLRYSRGGRTDKGVSALGQVVALLVRSTARTAEPRPEPGAELDYAALLNRVLPLDIRVLGWTDVPDGFSARFSAQHREYKYLIAYRPTTWPADAVPGAGQHQAGAPGQAAAAGCEADAGAAENGAAQGAGAAAAAAAQRQEQQAALGTELDVERMRQAAAFFIGEHDFRNFCKIDVGQVFNFRRKLLDFRIEDLPGCEWGGRRLLQLHIRGTAFLWHQVRCMASVLLMVGRGEEEPGIVARLLDLEASPRKPHYALASDEPLLLYSCAYSDLAFRRSRTNYQVVQGQLEDALESHLIRAGTLHTIQQRLVAHEAQQGGGIGGAGRRPRRCGVAAPPPGRHIPLLQRSKEPTVEERLARLAAARERAAGAASDTGTVDEEAMED